MIGQSISHYRILARLGAGGMGIVYRALDTRLDRPVALKFLSPHLAASRSAKERFLSEARAASALDHPNIGIVHDISETSEGNVFIVMAFYAGKTLRDELLGGPLPTGRALEIAIQVARGLSKAHERGIVHRDVKPGNLLLTSDGTVKILDFGLAKMAGIHLTSGGGTVGTPAYMAPEQVRGEPVDQRCDVWALGVVLYEMIAGRIPFQGPTEHGVFESILHRPMPPLPPAAGIGLQNALRRALAKHREDRFSSMPAFGDALADSMDGGAGAVEPETLLRPNPPVSEMEARTDEISCLQCGAASSSGMSFCGRCGHPLARRCSRCGSESHPKFRFCGSCGSSLAPASTPEPRQESHASGEQRQLTALSCELADFSSLSNWIEPEELGEILSRFRERSTEMVNRFEGRVVQYVGDGFLAYFGYPQAHEDDALRAVNSAVALLEALGEPNRELARRAASGQELSLRLRIGIHTGKVVTGLRGSGAGSEVLGNVPSLAAKIQQRAEPNEILASPETLALIQKQFVCEYMGSQDIPGLTAPLRLYRVRREPRSLARSSSEISGERGETVGRSQELQLFRSRWERVAAGMGQVVLVSGEPGIGKSRLTESFLAGLVEEPPDVIACQASPFFSNTPLRPVGEALRRLLGSSDGSSLESLEGLLLRLGLSPSEKVPHLAPLLGLATGERYRSAVLAPHLQKQRTLESLLSLFAAQAAERPLVLLVEDLHWVDPTTRELLDLLIDQGPTIPMLTVLTFRPDFSPAWMGRSHVTHITLDRLTDHEAERLVQRIAAGETLDRSLVGEILAKADGVPLYLEEITRMVLGSKEPFRRGGSVVPSTLQDSLMARLDRLSSAKPVVQLASVIGREFSFELLRELSPLDENALRDELAKLVREMLVYQRGIPPKATYTFKHALVQEAAYGSLLKSTRQQHHAGIAEALERKFPALAGAQPEVLGHHYTAAGRADRAIACWTKAGRAALARSAPFEASNHLRTGLALLSALPESMERDGLELGLQMSLFGALSASKGYGAEEVKEAQKRARELAIRLPPTADLVPVLQGLWSFAIARSSMTRGAELAAELMAAAAGEYAREAHYSMGVTSFFRADWRSAFHHLKRAAPPDPSSDCSHTSGTGADNAIGSLTFVPLARWIAGEPEGALEEAENALILARRRGHPLTLASALYLVGFAHQVQRDWERARELGREMEELAHRHGFLIWELGGRIAQGTADFEERRGSRSERLCFVRDQVEALKATGLLCWMSFYLSQIASMCLREDLLAEARSALLEARAMVDGDGEQFWKPEVYRLLGELERREGRLAAAGELFREARDMADRAGSRALAARAADSGRELGHGG